jgi:hypothetical protein
MQQRGGRLSGLNLLSAFCLLLSAFCFQLPTFTFLAEHACASLSDSGQSFPD